MSIMIAAKILIASVSVGLGVFLATPIVIRFWDNALRRGARTSIDRYLQLQLPEKRLFVALRVWTIIAIGATATLCWLKCVPFAIVMALLGIRLPAQVLDYLNRRRVLLLESQLAPISTTVSNGLRSGLSIHESLRGALDNAPKPIQPELRSIVENCDQGVPLEDCLSDTRSKLQIRSVSMFCLALEVAMEHSGQINAALERLSVSLQEWSRLRRKIEAETSSSRFAILVMSFCPFAFAGGMYLLGMSDVTLLFTSLLGQVMFSVVIALTWLGVRWATHITNIKVA